MAISLCGVDIHQIRHTEHPINLVNMMKFRTPDLAVPTNIFLHSFRDLTMIEENYIL